MRYWIITYFAGFKTKRVLILAQTKEDATAAFIKTFTHLRRYNVVRIAETTSTVFPLGVV